MAQDLYERRLYAILDAMPDLLFRVSRDGTFLSYHGARGIPKVMPLDDHVGRNMREIMPADMAEEGLRSLEAAFASGATQIRRHRLMAEGELHDFEVRFVAIDSQEALLIIRDVTGQERAERNFRNADAELRRILDTISESVWSVEVDAAGVHRRLFHSPGIEKLTGRPAKSFMHAGDWLAIVHTEDRERIRQLQDSLASGALESTTEEFRILWPDGSVRWVRTKIVATRLEHGGVRLDGIDMDVTEHRYLEEQLRQSQKMEAVGRLAGGIAHDFNNLLTVMTGYAYMLLEDLPAPSRAGIDEIVKCIDRASALTKRLLTFSKRQPVQLRELDLNSVVRDMETMLRRTLGDDIELRTALTGDARVVADPNQLELVVMNMVVNSRDAMPDGGRIIIATRVAALSGSQARRAGVPAGWYAVLSVSDNGSGMDEETRRRVFEPFFTTKEQGTGLGLPTAYAIIQKASGAITLETQKNRGTRFDIYLPALGQTQPEPSGDARSAGAPG